MAKKRTETPDLMASLMAAGDKPQQQPSKQQAQQDEPRVKATHALKESTLFRLEQALTQLRIQTGSRSLYRYDIVEEAILLALDELDKKGSESQIARRLAQR